jgi:hypothetical protein
VIVCFHILNLFTLFVYEGKRKKHIMQPSTHTSLGYPHRRTPPGRYGTVAYEFGIFLPASGNGRPQRHNQRSSSRALRPTTAPPCVRCCCSAPRQEGEEREGCVVEVTELEPPRRPPTPPPPHGARADRGRAGALAISAAGAGSE